MSGKPGGLAMNGRVRNWVYLEKGKPNFTRLCLNVDISKDFCTVPSETCPVDRQRRAVRASRHQRDHGGPGLSELSMSRITIFGFLRS